MGWKCVMCKREVRIDTNKLGMKCPYCQGKVFYKERPTIIKKIKAI